jgi:hypothetical protein
MNLHGTVDGMVVDDNAMTLTDLTVNTDGAAYAWAGTPERNVRHAGRRPGGPGPFSSSTAGNLILRRPRRKIPEARLTNCLPELACLA